MQKLRLTAGLLGLAGVALGALGAHALEARLAASGLASTWETAVLYHLVHAVAIFACSGPGLAADRIRTRAGWAWVLGVVLFSGSLYWLSLGGPRWLGPVTPLGGIFFLVGWGLIVVEALRRPSAA